MTRLISLVDEGRFTELFEELGWGYAPRGVTPITVETNNGNIFTARPVADQSGLRVWVVESDELPSSTEQRIIDAEVKRVSQLRLLIFSDGTQQSWRWPRRGATAATNTKLLHHKYVIGDEDLAEDLERRLTTIDLPIGERIGILDIQERMAKAFNDEAVKRSRQASRHMQIMNQQLLDAGCSTETASSLLVRLLFLFFGDDTHMWPEDTFKKWVLHHTTAENLADKLTELFEVVCDPELDGAMQRTGKYVDSEYAGFRRIDGMYREKILLPQLNEDFRQQVLKASEFDWAKVSPDIFGAMFQQLVELDDLRKNGEHYTSEEIIMKVIDPLFLEELRDRFENLQDDRAALLELQDEIASLTFMDPACGCGNFLIQSYKQLRGLELEIINRAEELELAEINEALDAVEGKRDSPRQKSLRARLQEIEGKNSIQFAEDALRKSKMSMRQFYGIEINAWPAKVAATAMLLVDHLCNQAMGQSVVRLPIEETPQIVHANALRKDWQDVVPAEECDYIIGNPPFIGARNQTREQKDDLINSFPPGSRNVGNVDYVSAWFVRTARYMGPHARAAFVSTNSVCQGEQVANIWSPIIDQGCHIDFAHNTFKWKSEAQDSANVFCVVVGFSKTDRPARLFDYRNPDSTPTEVSVSRLNPYLVDAPDILVWETNRPICDVPIMGSGNKPIDGGHYLFTIEEMDNFIEKEPRAAEFFRPWVGSAEFLKGKRRWVLWVGDLSPDDIAGMPRIAEKVEAVREYRLRSKSKPTQKLAAKPARFHVENFPKGHSILIPESSSERRRYVPVGFVGPETLCSNSVRLIPEATLYHFGVLHSQFHNAWIRSVGGRLKGDYRYSAGVVYNTFVWPDSNPKKAADIEECAAEILGIREDHDDVPLGKLYGPDSFEKYGDLVEAHLRLDAAVERAYGVDFGGDEKRITEHLFELYRRVSQ